MTRIAALVLSAAVLPAAASALPDAAVARAAAYSARHGGTSLLVWQRGRVLHEQGDGAAPRVFSVTKSLVAIGVVRETASGGLSLGQPVVHAAARGVPLAGLLNQTSGLPPAPGLFYTRGLRDKQPVLRGLRRDGGSGVFAYGPSHWEVLAEEIRASHARGLDAWLRRFVPGVDADVLARWRRDDAGTPFFSTGAKMRARELLGAAREVVRGLSDGRWPSEARRLLSAGTPANRMYALGFWLNRGAADPSSCEIAVEEAVGRPREPSFWSRGCLSRAAPADLVAMVGTRGQRVYVVPSLKLVVIRQGWGAGFTDAGFLGALFGG